MEEFIIEATNIYRGYARKGRKMIHRLTWEYYHGPIPKGFDIHHKDGNKMNNHIDNLDCIPHNEHLRIHMSENTLKVHAWHRSSKGKKFMKEKAEKEWAKREEKDFICEYCKQPFKAKHNREVKFCGDNCVMKARRASGVDNEERKCVICSNTFNINKYQKTLTCSKPCRAKHIGNLKRKF